jgi:hypothetical protein
MLKFNPKTCVSTSLTEAGISNSKLVKPNENTPSAFHREKYKRSGIIVDKNIS